MTQPAPEVIEAMDISCRQKMHNAGIAVKEAVRAHCDRDYVTARAKIDEAAAHLNDSRKFCLNHAEPVPLPLAPEQAMLL